MKKLLMLLLIALPLTGCGGMPRMNNDMIIVEAMKCEQARLPWRQVYNYDGTIREVVCVPRTPNTYPRDVY